MTSDPSVEVEVANSSEPAAQVIAASVSNLGDWFCLLATCVVTNEVVALLAKSVVKLVMSLSASVTTPVLPATDTTGPAAIADNAALMVTIEELTAATSLLQVVAAVCDWLSKFCIAGSCAAEQEIYHCVEAWVLV